MESASFALRDLFKREHIFSLITSFVLLGVAYLAEHFANVYAFDFSLRPTSNHVGDLVLDVIPAMNLNLIIVNVALIAIVLTVLFILTKPRYILFSLKALALFIIIRAFFVSLTHVGIHPEAIDPTGLGIFEAVYLYLNFQTGLFFSGHTGLPFLMALVFWRVPQLRYALFVLSFVFGCAVLLAHIHYSIDVFAAPFMAFAIYHIARKLFPRDHELIEEGYSKN